MFLNTAIYFWGILVRKSICDWFCRDGVHTVSTFVELGADVVLCGIECVLHPSCRIVFDVVCNSV